MGDRVVTGFKPNLHQPGSQIECDYARVQEKYKGGQISQRLQQQQTVPSPVCVSLKIEMSMNYHVHRLFKQKSCIQFLPKVSLCQFLDKLFSY